MGQLYKSITDTIGRTPLVRINRIIQSKAEVYGKLHRRVLDAGTWMAPSAYEVAFLSTAHDEADVDATIAAFAASLPAALGESLV